MKSSQPVSVVITTYNRSDALLAVLDGLTRQSDLNFEVIVADDGSAPSHCRRILDSDQARSLHLRHVWHPDVGFTASRARNRGVAASRHDYIIFLDGDCAPEQDFIAQHKRLAQEGYFVNGSRVLLSPEFTKQIVSGVELADGHSKLYWLEKRFCGHASKLAGLLRLPDMRWRIKPDFSWKGIRSCNMAVWKADFERVDGFDESFIGWGHEDADFVLRLHHAGIKRKNGFCATEVFHLWHKEAARDNESHNAKRVRERARGSLVRSTLGYSQQRIDDDVVITSPG